ncbi:MAG: hypothetical protein LBJ61_01575, partial [Deltaproteobacteria bacterium]|jgi:hypothetical protein|nr:hypothetical protein [Deltaproteobacteria bacterium]
LPANVTADSLKVNGQWDNEKIKNLWTDLIKDEQGVRTMLGTTRWDNVPVLRFTTYLHEGDISFNAIIFYALKGDKLIKLVSGINQFEEGIIDMEFATEFQHFINSLSFVE